MKLSSLLLILGLSVSLNTTASTLAEEIESVENGLRNKIHFSDTPLWNIKERMRHHNVPGASIAVVKDFKIHWVKHYGISDKVTQKSVSNETLFQAASISKPVTAYGALKLVEQQVLSLDSPVNTKLVDWKIPDNEFSAKTPVTLKHLLGHSSGLNEHGFSGYTKGEKIPTVTQILAGKEPANSKPIELDFQPGTRFRYSGGGYTVLQKLMSDTTNKRFPQIMDELVLSPVGMTKSSFEQPLLQKHLAATGYYQNLEPVSGNSHIYPEMAAAGLWANSDDLAKFVVDIQKTLKNNTGKVINQSTANNMLTPLAREFMGLGMYLMPKKNETYFLHEGTNKGFESLLLAHKKKGFGLVIMLNTNSKAFIKELKNSIAAYYQWDDFLPSVYTSKPITNKELKAAAERYLFQPDVSFSVYTKNGRLFMKEPLGPTQEMFKVGENEFITKTNDTKVSFQNNSKTGNIEYAVRMPNGKFWGRARLEDNENLPLDLVILGQVAEAEKAYVKFFEKRPKFKAPSEIGILQTIDKLAKQGKTDSILPLLKMSTRLYSTGNHSWKALADYFLLKENKEKAILTYENALKFQPKNRQFRRQINMLKEKVLL